VVRDCLVLTAHQTEKAGVEVTTDLQSTRQVTMSRTELQQVMVNLIINAVHAMPGGGHLGISVLDSGDAVTIEATDTGRGIAADVLKRIFDPFFTTKQAEGTGLGLSISQRLVGRAGGEISATSTVGQGSRFTVNLPAA
jgi:signal transduction histidine kinase